METSSRMLFFASMGFVCLLHLMTCPFTKVEESFNLQAAHDLIHVGWRNVSKFDHVAFPGVVPRTFLGAGFVSLAAFPFVKLFNALIGDKFIGQVVVRGVLGGLVVSGLVRFQGSLRRRFGAPLAVFHLLLTMTQFHFAFYATRTLPNTFALVLVLYALHFRMERKTFAFAIASAFSVAVFRAETAILLGAIAILEVAKGGFKFWRLLGFGVLGLILAIGASVAVDSYFWQRTLWPEGEVLYYNVILNKSSAWGVSPWYWYFTSAIPRALLSSVFLIPIGVYLERRSLEFVGPALVFVGLYSILPHKELRFIIYAFPMLNVAAAAACQRLWANRSKSFGRKLLALGVAAHLLANACATAFLVYVSAHNYPGGEAMNVLHAMETSADVKVHLDNLACQTGVSRFNEIHREWKYNKTERLSFAKRAKKFTHLITEINEESEKAAKSDKFAVLGTVEQYNGLKFNLKASIPVRIEWKPVLKVLKKVKHKRKVIRSA